MHRGIDEHRVKKRSFAFAFVYIKCFRTYSVYLSLRLPAQILYAGIHLPPQREARALPRRAPKSTTSERKIVTKETHQGCLSLLFKSPLPCKGEARALPRRAQNLQRSKPQKLSPPLAGCPHTSRCGAAPLRATFPKGKAKHPLSVLNLCSNKKIPCSKNQFEHGIFKCEIR